MNSRQSAATIFVKWEKIVRTVLSTVGYVTLNVATGPATTFKKAAETVQRTAVTALIHLRNVLDAKAVNATSARPDAAMGNATGAKPVVIARMIVDYVVPSAAMAPALKEKIALRVNWTAADA